MSVNVLYFASLRERVGLAGERIELPAGAACVDALAGHLRDRGGAWSEAFAPGRAWRASVNQRMAAGDSPVRDGDEVAFFPPVTGG